MTIFTKEDQARKFPNNIDFLGSVIFRSAPKVINGLTWQAHVLQNENSSRVVVTVTGTSTAAVNNDAIDLNILTKVGNGLDASFVTPDQRRAANGIVTGGLVTQLITKTINPYAAAGAVTLSGGGFLSLNVNAAALGFAEYLSFDF